MRLTCYLLVSHTGSVSVRKFPPDASAIRPGQLVLPLTISIPDAAFAVFLARAEIQVPDSQQFRASVELLQDDESDNQ